MTLQVGLATIAASATAVVLIASPQSSDAQVTILSPGADSYVFCVSEVGGETTKIVARTESRRAPARGERVALRARTEEAHLFDPVSGDRLE